MEALCVEMFIEQLITTAAAATQEDGARLLSAGYLYVAFNKCFIPFQPP